MRFLRFPSIILLVLLCGLIHSAKSQDIRITEFLAVNSTGIVDSDNTPQGWIEIWNPSASAPVNLGGYKLRHMGTVWSIPAISLPPRDRILIWASGKNRTTVTAPLHTSFTLNPAGGDGVSLELLNTANTVVSAIVNYPPQTADVSYGRDDAEVGVTATLVGYYQKPTPEAENNYEGTGVAGDVLFSRESGAINAAIQVGLSLETAADGAVIRYTTNGTIPTATSTLYTGPITVTTTQLIRARVFEPGKLPGEPEARCFLLLDASTLNFNSGMPIAVLTNFGAGTPVDGSGVPVENAGYMWVFEPGTDGRARLTNPPNLSVRVAMDRRGSSTLGNPKFNLNLETRKDRGDFEKDVSLLGMPAHSDWVFHAPYDFDRALVRNPFIYSVSNLLGRWAPHVRFAEVFIDINSGPLSFTNAASGDYYGVYNVFEKIRRGKDRVNIAKLDRYDNDAVGKTGGYIWKVDRRDTGDNGFATTNQSSLAYYYPKEVDIISNQRDPQEQYLRSFCQQVDTASYAGNFKDPNLGFRKFVDVDAAIDHHLMNVWPMNVDGLRLSGYMYKDRGGKLIFGPVWDFDRSMDSTDSRDDSPTTWRSQVSDFGTDFFNYPWWAKWFTDIDFYQAYIDRWVALRAGNGPFAAATINSLLDQLNSQMTAEAIQRDLVRWGRTKRNWTSPFGAGSFTGQTAEVQRIKDWMQQRANWMETQWVGAVTVSPAAGNVTPGTQVTLTGPANATIYYTTDGSDPRPAGGLAPTSPSTQVYTGPFTVSATTRVRARAYNPSFTALTGANNPPLVSKWSGRTDARFAVEAPATAGTVAVTEVNFHPLAPTAAELLQNPQYTDKDFEFIEYRNIGTTAIDLGGASFTFGINFSFTGENALSLAPGEYVIVASNPTAFALRYGAKPNVVGPYQGDLANSGERVTLVGAGGLTLVDFTYDDAWYPTTDGTGPSLVAYNLAAAADAFSTPANWRPSAAAGGTPGAADGPFVTTLDATDVGLDSAVVNAVISTNGVATTASFKIGETSYPVDPIPAGSGIVSLARTISGLMPHTTYSVKAEASDNTGLTSGNVIQFTTLNRDPSATNKNLHVIGRTPFEIDVLAGATDPDGDTLTVEDATQGQFGTVTIQGGKLLYSPADNYAGNDTFTFSLDDGFAGTASGTVTLTNLVPVALPDSIISGGDPVTFDPRGNDSDGDNDPISVGSASNGSYGAVTINGDGTLTYTPGSSYPGADTFTYTLTDGTAQATAAVSVRSTVPVAIGGLVIGGQVPGQASGTVYSDLSLPNSPGVIAGKVSGVTGKPQSAIFKADGTVQLKVGDPAPTLPGTTIATLGQLSGHAVIATLKGVGVSPSNDTVVYGGLDDVPRVLAREGDGTVPGTKIKQFLSLDGNGSTVFMLVKLAGSGVKPTNDLAVLAGPASAATKVAIREGDLLEGKTVSQLGTLLPSRPTLAEGRWRFDSETIGIRVVHPQKEQALYTLRVTAASSEPAILWARTTELDVANGKAKTLGVPGYSPDGVAYTTQLARVPRTITAANDSVLLRATDEGTAILAVKGSPAPGSDGQALVGLNFAKFSDPVGGAQKRTAFVALLAGGGVKATNKTGIWYFDGASNLRLLARAGDPVEGGGSWGTFDSLALPDGEFSGPIFTASLARNAALGITAANNRGLWAVNGAGVLQQLIRTGQPLKIGATSRVVKSFEALTPLAGVRGVASGYTDNQQVSAIVTFIDGTKMVVNITIP